MTIRRYSRRLRRLIVKYIFFTHCNKDGKNAKMIAFGIGPSIREQDLNEIAGEKNWFYVDKFPYMKERIPDLLKTACIETTL